MAIPTFRRAGYLSLCLSGLERQTRRPDEIVVGCRDDDRETLEWLRSYAGTLPLTPSAVKEAGVVANMQEAVARTSGDIVCLLDDDAEPEADWLARIEAHFEARPALGALGGRDVLQYLPEGERELNLVDRVGVSTCYGKVLGNHHCGRGGFRTVEVVKGCNCAFRGDVLRKNGFERRLRGRGAQSEWEWALCLDLASRGFEIGYDPGIRVAHHVAPRHDNDQNHRGGFDAEGVADLAFNQAFVIHSRMKGGKRFVTDAYGRVVGSKILPGWAQYARLRWAKGEAPAFDRWRATRRGWSQGRRAGLAARRDGTRVWRA